MDVVGLLLDVGPSMGHEDQDGVSPLGKSKDIISMFVQRKIFSQSEDRVCLFTYGSVGTANELADNDEYQHISMERDLRPSDWDLCTHVQNQVEATNHQVDFLDALIVTSTYLMNQINSINDKKIQKKMEGGRRVIMVFSNLDNPVRIDMAELQNIIQGFKENQMELHFVGLTGLSEDDNTDGNDQPGTSAGAQNRPPGDGNSKPKTPNQLKSEAIVQKIVSELDGCAYGFREAMAAVSVFENKKKNSVAWSPDLVIGPTLRIPISGYKMVSREPLPPFKRCAAANSEEPIEKKYDTFLPDDTITEVDKQDIIKGYRYGTDLVPFTEDDMANMKYKCDAREFSVIGFTNSDNVKRHHFAGKDTMLIAGKKLDEAATVAISALCKALHETEMVAIVRKVYSARSSPSLGVLIPVIESDNEFLCFVELPFMEDMRELEFPTLLTDPEEGKNAPTEEQLRAVDGLINAMDMSAQPEDYDPLEPSELPNPTLQRLYQVLAARAVDPSCALPEVAPSISDIVNNVAYSCRWIEQEQEDFAKLFKLERLGKSGKKNGENIYKDSSVAASGVVSNNGGSGEPADSTRLRDLDQDTVTEVRTFDPARDFRVMIKQHALVTKAYIGMTERIMQLVTDSVGTTLFDKALQCLKVLRDEAVAANDKDSLQTVNHFLVSIKSLLVTKGPNDFWELIVQERVSLIDSSEASNSDISPSEKLSYLTIAEEKPKEEIPAAMADDEDLLDMI